MKKTLSILLLFTATLSFAQNEITREEKPYIEVVGTAEKQIVPDEIYISIIIREKYQAKTKISIEEQEEKLRNVIKTIGVNSENLSLSDANADYVKVKWQRKEVLTKKDYVLKVSNATTIGQVFQKLEELEIDDAYISNVTHSKIDSLNKEVKIMAIKSAKQKADYLLNEIGEKTGKALIVTEVKEYDNSGGDRPLHGGYTMALPQRNISSISGSYKNISEDIQFQKIRLSANIYVKFGIK